MVGDNLQLRLKRNTERVGQEGGGGLEGDLYSMLYLKC